jgi:hypothetical protein
MEKSILFMCCCLSFNTYALPDQTDEINKKIGISESKKIEFEIIPMNTFNIAETQPKEFNFMEANKYSFYSIEKNNHEYGYNYNYSMEEITKDAIAMLSTHLLSFLLPESWAISLEYNIIEDFKSGIEDEKFLINIKTEI